MAQAVRRVRLDLDEREARALHAGIQEALAAHLVGPDNASAARDVLDRLSAKVPSWLDRAAIGGEAGYLIAAQAVLRALATAEERGSTLLSEHELAHALGADKPAGVSIADVLTRMRRALAASARRAGATRASSIARCSSAPGASSAPSPLS